MTVRGRTEWQKLVDEKLKDHDKRLTEAEKEQAVYKALAEEQRTFMLDRFNRVQDNINGIKKDLTDDVKSIKSAINKVLWTIAAAVILAAVQFVLSGGLILSAH